MTRINPDGSDTCGWGCQQRLNISNGFLILLNATEAVGRALRTDEPDRPKKEFRFDGRMMLGDRETWESGLPENVSALQDDPVDVERSLLHPVIDNIVNLIIKDEGGVNNDPDRIRRISSSLSILSEAFERVVTNGGTIADSDRAAISQGVSGILQLAFYPDLRQPE